MQHVNTGMVKLRKQDAGYTWQLLLACRYMLIYRCRRWPQMGRRTRPSRARSLADP